jgi:drug/metabolite transporter (DMT)-like permease
MNLRRGAVIALAAAALLGTGLVVGARAAQQPRSWVTLDGRDWTQFAPREKQSYVAGFLAGAAGAAANTLDTALTRRAVDSLYRAGGLRFPFGHMVYATQLNEFYWWDNHIPIPLYLALSSINQRLHQQRHDP